MRITLVSHMPHSVTIGGAQKALRCCMEELSARGHEVEVICARPTGLSGPTTDRPRVKFLDGIRVIECGPELYEVARAKVRSGRPDVVVAPTEDPEQRPLASVSNLGVPTVALAQTPATLPFGPGAAYICSGSHEQLRSATKVVASSEFLARYIHTWGNLDATAVRLPICSPRATSFRRDRKPSWAVMVNPAPIKGLPIFLEVARSLPHRQFAALVGWATEAADRRALAEHSNIRIFEPVGDIYGFLARARVLLVPSLWIENVPLIISEAMIAGVPVCAADIGGVSEVASDAATLLPVNPLRWDRRPGVVAEPVVPRQPVARWVTAVEQQMNEDEAAWQRRSGRLRASALSMLSEGSVGALEAELSGAAADR
jgi:glycosyltransferase involved in cell wall biosynthesis